MAIDTSIPRTRRALLAAALGAAAATVASALGRPSPAAAASGTFDSAWAGTPAVSATNTAASGYPAYGVDGRSASTDGTGVLGNALAGSGATRGVSGQSASRDGTGVLGFAIAGTGATRGVSGLSGSTSGTAVRGHAFAASGATRGVYGLVSSPDGTAVIGYSGTGADPAPVAKTGVYGYAVQDAAARGVYGRSTAGRGVFGQATSGTGVYATATSGYALRAVGRVKLDKCAGVATIAATKSTVVVTPGIDLTASSAVVATLQGSAGSATTTVSRCVVNVTTNTFTIYLTKAATVNVKVAWHVFG